MIMNSIIDNQREILLSVQGTNIWSGQQPQQYNSQAIAWGGLRCGFFQVPSSSSLLMATLSHELFAIGKRYQWVAWAYLIGFIVPVPFWIAYKLWPKLRTDYLYTPVIWYVGLCVLSWLTTILKHFISTATLLVGFALALTHRSSLSSPSLFYHNGG